MNRTKLNKPQIVYICSWVATALAVCFTVAVTGCAEACFAFIFPAVVHIPASGGLDKGSYKRGLHDAWNSVNDWIVPGDLPGNGTDKSAERNGLILASNAIMELVIENRKEK